jgi:hypothetical protein
MACCREEPRGITSEWCLWRGDDRIARRSDGAGYVGAFFEDRAVLLLERSGLGDPKSIARDNEWGSATTDRGRESNCVPRTPRKTKRTARSRTLGWIAEGRISRLLQCTPLVLCAKRRVKSRFHGRSRARRLNGINIMLGLATSRTSGRVESIHGIVSPA